MCCECSSVNRFCPQPPKKPGQPPNPQPRDILGRWPPSLPLSSVLCSRFSINHLQKVRWKRTNGSLPRTDGPIIEPAATSLRLFQTVWCSAGGFGECLPWLCQLTEVSTQQSVWVTPAPSNGADIHTNNYRLINQFPILAPWFSSQRGACRAWHLGLPCCLC